MNKKYNAIPIGELVGSLGPDIVLTTFATHEWDLHV